MKMIGRKTSLRAWEHPVFLALFCAWNKSRKKLVPVHMLKKNTSDVIEPRAYELGTIQTVEVWYFRVSIRISPGSLVSRTLVKGNKGCWNENASIPVETTSQSVRKNNLWYHRRFRCYLITDQCVILANLIWTSGLTCNTWSDKQPYRGLVHTTPEISENATLFLRLGLPSTVICHENGRSWNEKTLFKPEEIENAGFVF